MVRGGLRRVHRTVKSLLERSHRTRRKTCRRRGRGVSLRARSRELETIVSRLEQGEVDLEDSIALYERGQ